jgi:hypothetical protein
LPLQIIDLIEERYVRFAPSMRNLPEETETVLREVRQLR